MLRKLLTFMAVISSVFSLASADDCYLSSRIWIVIKHKSGGGVFETYKDWQENKRGKIYFTETDIIWCARQQSGLLTDWQIFEKLGQNELAGKIKQDWQNRGHISTWRFILGLPLGIGMMAGSAMWGNKLYRQESPGVIEVGGAIVLGIAGLGISLTSTSDFISTRKTPYYRHFVSLMQVAEAVDRYNTTLKQKCKTNNM